MYVRPASSESNLFKLLRDFRFENFHILEYKVSAQFNTNVLRRIHLHCTYRVRTTYSESVRWRFKITRNALYFRV